MLRSTSRLKAFVRRFGLLVGLALFCPPATARELVVRAEAVQQDGLSARGVLLALRSPNAPGGGLQLRLQAETLAFAPLGYRFAALDWRCELRPRDVGVWRCAGPLTSDDAAAGELALEIDRGALQLALVRGRTRLQASLPAEGNPIGLTAEHLPAAWLQPMLAALWPQAGLTAGRLGAELALDLAGAAPRIEGELQAEGLGFDTEDGRLAAADLQMRGRLALTLAERTELGLELALSGGEVLAGPLYASLPAQPVQLALSLQGKDARWSLQTLRWNDREALQLDARAELDFGAAVPLLDASLKALSPRAGVLLPRYLETLLATAGLPGLQADGSLELALDLKAGRIESLGVEADDLALRDGQSRFLLEGVSGGLGFTRGASARSDQLRIERLQLFGASFAPAVLDWASSDGEWRLQRPLELGVLGGGLQLQALRWNSAAEAGSEDRFAAAASVRGIDLRQLSAQLGWPPFEGELSGDIPGVHYGAGVLAMDGTLRMRVFDGDIEIAGLALERPFGVAPTLAADVELRSLDLQPLTAAFGFGEITGRMDGYIRGLRLIDWAPVAFDARFATDEKAKGPRRISQRAVRDLSSVGGMGPAAALQQGVMRAFETFPYARIGIACRLRNHVCQMDGLARTARGYTLVEGSGLPRISVNGMQREVDWPVLVERLRAVTEGQAPTIH
ncbi:hypothetical protein [Aquimonas voraii]|uniref:Dicarboxylate transport n=1 Tax=Aquimonas voraii TaxID=265719 RepID=A0A1G6SRZ2_9GAMM|nr:hypothetical protein [Aquimonas voraii]SDD19589.1 hypothetical protein SAMN04488509_101659 [Aquimonas voraii]